jgi:peptide deformylase
MTMESSPKPESPLRIVNWPAASLKQPCQTVVDFDADLKRLAADMFDLMRQAQGVGLAAPQVGRNIRLFVMNHSGKAEDDRAYVNPTLTPLEGELEAEEGCLSIPDVRINVWRADRVKLEAQDLDGKPVSIEADGFETRVWQHETDHLLGILLTDRMGFSDKMRWRKKLKSLQDAAT